MPALKAFYRPRDLSEALSLLREHGERARPLAGGTSLIFSKAAKLEALVDLGRLGLDRIEERPDGLAVGAMVKVAQLRRFLAARPPGALLDATEALYTRLLQHHITVGGNCVMVYGWSDLPVVMWCLGARFTVEGQGRRDLPADQFFAQHPTRLLDHAELLVSVTVPPAGGGRASAYRKFSADATGEALAAAAAQVQLAGDNVEEARIVVGAVRPFPQLLPRAAKHLVGQAADDAQLAAAARVAADDVLVSNNYRASAEYRRELVATLAEDALRQAVARAGGAA